MKNLTVGSKAINSTLICLIENPGKWVGTETGKMVTRWDEELKFECENEDGSVWYTDNILEAVEWLYCGDIDNRELFFLDQQFVDDVTEAAKKQAKREAQIEVLKGVKKFHDMEAKLFGGTYMKLLHRGEIDDEYQGLANAHTRSSIAVQGLIDELEKRGE